VNAAHAPDDALAAALDQTLANARERLLAARGPHGHWEGELSSSALSTATALFALHMYREAAPTPCNPMREQGGRPADLDPLIASGLRWLAEHQNADGGWGDTTQSHSNISTTALCWAAFAADTSGDHAGVVKAAETWLAQAAGSLEPRHLAEAIAARYGADRTFSVPILTMLALAGRLGPAESAWRLVPQLPFELAACPYQWFKWLRLPVVSYALPALIAIGNVRHTLRPSRNPFARLTRRLAKRRALSVLEEIQPTSGGFLEAAPLTSFVVMSLLGAGEIEHPVVRRGSEFLVRSARGDGSWPIDTNLATWVTTLAIGALAADRRENASGKRHEAPLPAGELHAVRNWLLDQQYKVEHPYTRAAPGGWAWTDLTGGVPDADDTPGALLALRQLSDAHDRAAQSAASAGVTWLLDLQNSDGGLPTFCRGWGKLPFDRSSADLTAHAIRAWCAWRGDLPAGLQARIDQALPRAVSYLVRTQRSDGAWAPLWFGNQHAPDDINLTYGASRVLRAGEVFSPTHDSGWRGAMARAADWLLRAQNPDGGWGGDSGTPSSVEETALAIDALAGAGPFVAHHRAALHAAPEPGPDAPPGVQLPAPLVQAIQRGVQWLVEHTEHGTHFPPSPIGFYFARLWYYERLYPLVYTVSALGRAARVVSR
jgi:squalene-hopene/tetraprenyl-beta-curcumene cyclase